MQVSEVISELQIHVRLSCDWNHESKLESSDFNFIPCDWLPVLSCSASSTTGHSSFNECRRHSAKAILHSAKALPSVTLGKERLANCTSATASLSSTFCRALDKEFTECHLTLGKEKSPSRRQVTVTDPLPSVFFGTRQRG
jgi:hypothetical protein